MKVFEVPHIEDVLLHCFDPGAEHLMTLCGQNYANVMFAHWPLTFAKTHGATLCKECSAHPDLPLHQLGDVG